MSNRRSFIKRLAALPLLGVVAAKANDEQPEAPQVPEDAEVWTSGLLQTETSLDISAASLRASATDGWIYYPDSSTGITVYSICDGTVRTVHL